MSMDNKPSFTCCATSSPASFPTIAIPKHIAVAGPLLVITFLLSTVSCSTKCEDLMFFSTLGRLAAIVGTENVGTPRHADTHRPGAVVLSVPSAFVPERRVPAAPANHGPLLRRLRPPVAVTVELTDAGDNAPSEAPQAGTPAATSASDDSRHHGPPGRWDSARTYSRPSYLVSSVATGSVTILRGPFRANGEWWSLESWACEEWDVQIDAGLYRLLHLPKGWFIEGIYD